MDHSLLDLLRRVDTPTVCNAIETVQGRRGFQGFTRGTMLCSAPHEAAVVGYAVTAQIAAREPSRDPPEETRARRLAYYRMMHDAPKPAVAVIQDLDHPACVGAFWGEVNTSIHQALGVSGALTNGVMRDLGDLPAGFPVIAGSIGPSHAFVSVHAIATAVTINELQIAPGALIHADRHGAVVVPDDVIHVLEAAIMKLQATERLILDPAKRGEMTWAEFERAWSDFEKART